MATEIDNRIVEMQFDNKQFESGVKQTTETLDKFKESLKFEGAKTGFEEIERAAGNVKLQGIGNAVEEVSAKFSALDMVAMSVVNNITSRFTNMAVDMVKSLSIDNFAAGWQKYEQELGNFQTIFNNAKNDAGEMINTMADGSEYVKAQMNKLMWYTDETSYSFQDMVANIGRFTSNGIGLETAVTSMMGIANAAGLSGTSIQSASHAMDGFSKAMGQGKMTRQNWRWIETARMDTEKFKQTMIDAAVEVGTLIDLGDGVYQTLGGDEVATSNFLEALKDGWMDVEVMNKALGKFGAATEEIYAFQKSNNLGTADEAIEALAGDLDDLGLRAFQASQEAKTFKDAIESVKDAVSSGWMKTFELIFGDYEESVEMWTALANNLWEVFAGPAETRNDILQYWHDFGGREALLEGMCNTGRILMKILSDVRETFADVFELSREETPGDQMGLKSIANDLTEICEQFADFTGVVAKAFGAVDEETEEVEESLSGLVNVFNDVHKAFTRPDGYLNSTDSYLLERAGILTDEMKQLLIESALEVGTLEQTVGGLIRTKNGDRLGFGLDEATESYYDFIEAEWATAEVWENVVENHTDKLHELGLTYEEVTESTNKMAQAGATAAEILKLANLVIEGAFGSGESRRKAIEAQGVAYERVQNKVNELLGSTFRYKVASVEENEVLDRKAQKVKDLYDSMSMTDEEYKAFTENSKEVAYTGLDIGGLFVDTVRGLADVLMIIHEVSKGIIGDIVLPIIQWGVPKLIGGFLQLTGAAGRFLTSVLEPLRDSGQITMFFFNIRSNLYSLFRTVDDFIEKIKQLESFQNLGERVNNFFNNLRTTFTMFSTIVNDKFKQIVVDTGLLDRFVTAFDTVMSVVVNIIDRVTPYINNFLLMLGGGLATALDTVIGFFNSIHFDGSLITNVALAFDQLSIALHNMFDQFKMTPEFQQFVGMMKTYLGVLRDTLYVVVGFVTQAISNLDLSFVVDILYVIVGAVYMLAMGIKNLFEIIRTYMEKSKIRGYLGTVKARINTYLGYFKEAFAEVKEQTNKFQGIKIVGEAVGKVFKDLTSKVTGFGKPLKEIIAPALKTVTDRLTGLIKPVKELISKIKYEDLMKFVKIFSILVMVFSAASIFKNIGGIFKSISWVFDSVSGVIKAFKNDIKANTIIKYAAAIGILAASIWAVAQIPKDQLKTATACLLEMAGALGGLLIVMTIMNKLTTNSELLADSGLMLGLASLIGVITYTILAFKDMDFGTYAASWIKAAGVLVLVLGCMYLLNRINMSQKFLGAKQSIKNGIALFLFATSLKKMVDALVEIADYDLLKLQGSLIVLVEVMGILGGLAWAAGHMTFGSGIGMIAIVGAIYLFVKAMEALEGTDFKKVNSTIEQFRAVFQYLFWMAIISRIAGQGALGVAGIILATMYFLQNFADACQKMASIPKDKFDNVMGAMSLLMVLVDVLIALSSMTSIKGMIAVAGILGSLTFTIVALTALIGAITFITDDMKALKFKMIADTISKIIGMLALLVGAAGFASTAWPTILTLAAVIGAIGGIFYLMDQIKDIDKTMKMVDKIITVLTELVAGMAILAGLEAFAHIGLFLNKLGYELMKGLVAIGVGIGVGIAAIGAGIAVAGVLITVVGTFFANLVDRFVTIFERITDISKTVEKLNGEKIKANFENIAAGLKAFAQILGAQKDGTKGFRIWSGLQMGSLFTLMDALAKLQPMVKELGSAGFPTAMENLITLGDKLKEFAGKVSNLGISEFEIENFGTLASNIGSMSLPLQRLTKIDSVDKIKDVLTAIGEGMVSFGKALATDENGKKMIDPNLGSTINKIFEAFVPMANGLMILKDIDGLVIKERLKAIGYGLEAFAKALCSKECDNVYFDTGKTNGIVRLVGSMETLANGLQALNGIDTVRIENVLTSIGNAMKAFGEAINTDDIWDALGSEGKARSIATLIGEIGNLGTELNKFISMTDQFYGSMGSTGEALDPKRFRGTGMLNYEQQGPSKLTVALGYISEALTTFAESIKSTSIADALGSEGKAGAIVKIMESIHILGDEILYFVNTLDPIKDKLTGENGLMSVLSIGLGAIGDAIGHSGWANLMAEKKGEGIREAMAGIRHLANGIKVLADIGDSEKAKTAADDMKYILGTIREAVFEFSGPDGIEGGNMATVITSIISLFDQLQTYDFEKLGTLMDGTIQENMATGFDEMKTPLGEKMIEVIDTVIGVMQDGDRQYNFYSTARALIGFVKDGFEDRESEISGALAKTLDTALGEAKKKGDQFQDVGTVLIQGLATGIAEGLDAVKAAIKDVIDKAEEYALSPEVLNAGSPSHRFRDEVGLIGGLGIADGFIKSIPANKEAVQETIMSALDAAAYAIDHKDSSALQPTLVPVLDMSEMSKASIGLSDMFDNNYALDIAKAQLNIDSRVQQFDQLVDLTNQILGSIQNGSDLYLDDSILAGRINRRLGAV